MQYKGVKRLIFPVFRVFSNGKTIYLRTFDEYEEAMDWVNLQWKYLTFDEYITYTYKPIYAESENAIEFCNRNLRLIKSDRLCNTK